jgi:hypothetical protein
MRVAPAMAAGVADKLFDMAGLVAIVKSTDETPSSARHTRRLTE